MHLGTGKQEIRLAHNAQARTDTAVVEARRQASWTRCLIMPRARRLNLGYRTQLGSSDSSPRAMLPSARWSFDRGRNCQNWRILT